MGRNQMHIIDRNFYKKFKEEYNRICRKLKKEAISQRDWDRYNKLVCRTVMRRELGETFNRTLRYAGCKVLKRSFSKEESEELNRKILNLRLEGDSYREISEILGISIMTARRRTNKMYECSNKNIKDRLDYVKNYNIEKRYLKKNMLK